MKADRNKRKKMLTESGRGVIILFVPETGRARYRADQKKIKTLLTGSIWFDSIDLVAARERPLRGAAEQESVP
ncbi:hypothetical protein SAMN04488112_1262 [Melghirimyces thermohalophilus]|uniref:Uncharacterized protein n=1 Tax=Melghirimyces thermohalophilus TaxID=1236220 RepID=A0A1G6R588_9BACL|nr:hypothetical protein [Melghirimyces thermohalophilus]SDC99444.1 hypothetical protein SAMN04488112_1262 [Melghirimyces thermohalophilus]